MIKKIIPIFAGEISDISFKFLHGSDYSNECVVPLSNNKADMDSIIKGIVKILDTSHITKYSMSAELEEIEPTEDNWKQYKMVGYDVSFKTSIK